MTADIIKKQNRGKEVFLIGKMRKEQTIKAIGLTAQVLQDFHQMHPEKVYSFCDDDVTWIGAQKEQFIIGLEAFREELDRVVADMYPCHMENEEFLITENEGSTCTVIGRYLVVSDEGAAGVIAGEQRCVVVWRSSGKGLRILHISTTSPIGEWAVTEDEHFVRSLGSTLKKFISRRLDAGSRRLLFTERNGNMFTMQENGIIYAEAQKKHCRLVLEDQDVEIRENFSAVKEKTAPSGSFMQISRSYLINIWHIDRISKDSVTMDNGTAIRFPDKKKAQIRQELRKRFL